MNRRTTRRRAAFHEADEPRDLRLFAYHCLNVAGSKYQNTAFWDDEARSLVHYKRD